MNYNNLLLTTEEAEAIAKKYYRIEVKATLLQGYEDVNFMLQTEQETYLLKVSSSDVDEKTLEYQTAILEHLSRTDAIALPKPIRSIHGHSYFEYCDKNNFSRFVRLQSWVKGNTAAEQKYHRAEFLQSWGKAAGTIVTSLHDFQHETALSYHDWDLSHSLKNRTLRPYIPHQEGLEIADYFWDLFENNVVPQQAQLRKSVIHGDLNDYNTITNNTESITGIIDFGDSTYSHTINELAIAIAYAIMFKPNPLEAAANLVKGFHQVYKIHDNELQILYPLVANRLLMTATNAAKNRTIEPENTYLFVSEQPAWDVLKKWYKIPANLAYYTFRNACQLEPCPKRPIFDQWFSSVAFAKIIDFKEEPVLELDLSVSSLDIGNNCNFASPRQMQKKIDDILWENDTTFGIGGYGEVRPFYNADAYISEGNIGRQWRTCHIGLDIWAKEKTPVFAAFDGAIFSIQDNKGDDNYGPTIIIEHHIHDNLTFYTLYGHLSPIDEYLKVGQPIKKGQQIATIGTFPQNGNWAEHLHFQIILDLLEEHGDFYGVCLPDEKTIWLSICPDIANKLYIPRLIKKSHQTIDKASIIQKRQQLLGSNLSLSYDNPLHIVRAFQQFLYDENGRRYLDTVNNVAHVGHQHPTVVKAAQRQIELLNTNTRYLHQNIVEYGEQLLATFPAELCVVYFVNSGSEANELALRMAKTYTNEQDIIAVEVGYHGNTNTTIGVSSYKFEGKGGNGKPTKTHIVPKPDTYRGQFTNPDTAGKMYADFVEDKIETVIQQGSNIAGFICESILSCGGQIVLPTGYLKNVYEFVRQSGGVCIADEVQVGFGRVGRKFWGFELQDVIPDIVTLGKPIGNGHPLAAVVTTRQIADAFDNGMEYFNTFGGNPVSCSVGKAVLEVIQNEKLQQNALDVGDYLKKRLINLKQQFGIIGDVRGVGFFLGIELVRDKITQEAADTEANFIINRMREKAILMSTDGPLHNVLKIKPPMCFTKKDADFLVKNLEQVLKELP